MPQTPPPAVSVVSFPTPQTVDRVLVEEVDTRLGDYRPLQPGEPHRNSREYPGFVFVLQRPSRAESWIQRFYVNTRSNQDVYNASESFSAEANAYPIFSRSYIEKRETYAPLTKGSTLTGVIGVKVTAGGTGYPEGTATTVTQTAGAGTGATFQPIIYRGVLYGVVVLSEGTGYNSAALPTLTVTGTGGASATVVAIVQPVSAILVKEDAQRMEGDPLDSLYLRVTRIYETIPGPILSRNFYTEKGELATETTQNVLAGTAPTADSLLVLSSSVTPRDSVVSIKRTVTIPAHQPIYSWSIFMKSIGGVLYLEKVTKTIIDPSTKPTGGAGVLLDKVQDISATKAERTVVEVTDSAGVATGSIPDRVLEILFERERVVGTVTFRTVPASTAVPVYNAAFGTGKVWNGTAWVSATAYVHGFKTQDIPESANVLQIIEAVPVPPTRYEYVRSGFQFPAIYEFLNTFHSADAPDGAPAMPWLGVHFNYLEHRNASAVMRAKFTYQFGPPASFGVRYTVSSPGAKSKIWPIDQNTIHPALNIYVDDGSGPVLVETFAASSPSSYSPSQVLIADAQSGPWKGLIYENVLFEVSESTDPAAFPP